MRRNTFLTISAVIAMVIGLIALCFPTILLKSKGIVNNPQANVWMSEVGILLIAIGTMVYFIRNESYSRVIKAVIIGIIMIQLGLLIIEVYAYYMGIITEIMGIIPNSIIHIVLIIGLFHYLVKGNREI
ncbi:hypothetical protein PY092_13370 [Muricauda sp. 334s03]|uniref:DUF4293 family protein n=1 Tax=Flagellimonas yonaguniensis TaxID=3031325 RepID=A0ABT5Y251_9FLAO|nr:hypothetical protein [[Muricauda] yonaguniensis]MDF0717147.1 hypothetical protein [[Muricauda] yonaguniensis]